MTTTTTTITISQRQLDRLLPIRPHAAAAIVERLADGRLMVNTDHPGWHAAAAGAASKIVRGAAGLAKAAARIDRADRQTIAARRAACDGCDSQQKAAGLVRLCGACSCALAAKQRIAGEVCPRGKWPLPVITGAADPPSPAPPARGSAS